MFSPWENPFYPGPGQPQYQNYWTGPAGSPQFNMPPAGLANGNQQGLATGPAYSPPPPAVPDAALRDASSWAPDAAAWTSAGGGPYDGGMRDQAPGTPGSGIGAGKGGIGSYGSLLGGLGTAAGLFAGPFGGALGLAGNLGGSWIDARLANNGLASQGLPRGVNALPAALAHGLFGLLGNIGLGRSVQDQVGDIKNAAAGEERFANPAPTPNPGVWNGIFGDAFGTDKDYVGGGGDSSGSSSGDGGKADPGKGGDSWGGGTGGTSGWYAKGGKVSAPMLGAADPPGPDDQVAGLQTGEGVLTRKAMKRHPGLLDALNAGDIKKARGLLGGAK